jgi:CHAD domain-containing protein
MMPDPRHFVLDADPDQEPGDPLAGVRAALSQAFTVTAETPATAGVTAAATTRSLTWLDTFDWRLYGAGLILEQEHDRRNSRIILTSTSGDPLAEQPATGWQTRRPTAASDIPPGPVNDIIGPLVAPRALIPIAKAVSTRTALRLINEDGKTVVRLLAEQTSTADGHPAPLRLTIAEVRGYPAQARRAAAILATVARPAVQTTFTAALAGQHKTPGDYSGKVDAKITAQMPAVTAVATIMLALLDTLEQNVDGVLRDVDTEFLHDLRVAVRRTRAAIKLLGAVLPGGLAARYKDEFKWLGDLTTPLRDLDVHLLGFDDLAGSLQAFTPADLEPFREFLIRRRAQEFRRLAAGLRSPRFRTLVQDWRKALQEILGTRTRSRKPVAALAAERTISAVTQLTRRGTAITAASQPESLHDLRKRGKEVRYLLEFFAPIYDADVYRQVVSDLKKLQDCLGEFQDSEVQRVEIAVLARAMPTHVQTILAMGEISARLAASQQAARADFSARFARFAAPVSQRRIRELLAT